MLALKTVFTTGKTLEERAGAQGLREGWQLWGVTDQPAVLDATDRDNWHHTLRKTGIKRRMDRRWVIISSLIVALHRSPHLVYFLWLQGIEIGCFKQNPRF